MKLEIDRRRIRDRITHLERELEHLSMARRQRKERRVETHIPIVSIVGYTNAGKSTLLNALTKSSVRTEDLLFATLDTASRRLRFPREREVIVTDTVGFIRELPEDLFGAFRATYHLGGAIAQALKNAPRPGQDSAARDRSRGPGRGQGFVPAV
jgi:GTP-binding protein HflX